MAGRRERKINARHIPANVVEELPARICVVQRRAHIQRSRAVLGHDNSQRKAPGRQFSRRERDRRHLKLGIRERLEACGSDGWAVLRSEQMCFSLGHTRTSTPRPDCYGVHRPAWKGDRLRDRPRDRAERKAR